MRRWLGAQREDLAAAVRAANEEINAQVAAASAKDRENSQLWEQARRHEAVNRGCRGLQAAVLPASNGVHIMGSSALSTLPLPCQGQQAAKRVSCALCSL